MPLHHILVDVGAQPGLVGMIRWPFSMRGGSVNIRNATASTPANHKYCD
jgi:hypothetical protein